MIQYKIGDIQNEIKNVKDNSIDLIYTDPPFQITKSIWDKGLDWKNLFPEMWRVVKPNGIIILYSSMPFTYELLQYEKPKYHYIWVKNNSTGFLTTKYQPLRKTEEIFIYYKKNGTYNPQMIGDKFVAKRNVKYGGENDYWGIKNLNEDYKYIAEGGHKGKYPTNVLNYEIRKDKTGITRTDEHIDYFIKTYTNEDDTILDMTCHNKFVGNRAEKLKRNYIGIDINEII